MDIHWLSTIEHSSYAARLVDGYLLRLGCGYDGLTHAIQLMYDAVEGCIVERANDAALFSAMKGTVVAVAKGARRCVPWSTALAAPVERGDGTAPSIDIAQALVEYAFLPDRATVPTDFRPSTSGLYRAMIDQWDHHGGLVYRRFVNTLDAQAILGIGPTTEYWFDPHADDHEREQVVRFGRLLRGGRFADLTSPALREHLLARLRSLPHDATVKDLYWPNPT